MNINFRSQRLLPGYDFLQSQPDSKPVKVLVHEFIQNVVFTPFPQDGELQVERLTLAANIYEGIGFRRKAAFYRRFAALKAVTIQPNWQVCYDSLLNSIDDFGLTLDPVEYEKALADRCSSVWPSLHIQLIEELVTCCKKIQTAQAGTLAIRHISFMLHTLDFHIPATRKKEFARELEEFSTVFGEDSPVPLKLSSGYIVPTVNLTKYPLCIKFEPLALPPPLRPNRILKIRRKATLTPNLEEKSDNPFIFTPIASYSSIPVIETRRTSTNSLVTGVTWVQDEPCTVLMMVRNSLPFELRVSSINILSDGIPLETKPQSLNIEPDSTIPTSIQLVGVPRQSAREVDDGPSSFNKIQIFGYSTHLLGVKSNCRLDMIPRAKFPSQYIVDVSPPLPRIEFQFPEEAKNIFVDPIPVDQVGQDLVVMEIKISIPLNDQLKTQLTILNCSNVDVNYLVIDERPIGRPSGSSNIISWDEEAIDDINTNSLKAGSKIKVPLLITSPELAPKLDQSCDRLLSFEYSGGNAFKDMYCRKCAIKIHLDIIESQKDDPVAEESIPVMNEQQTE